MENIQSSGQQLTVHPFFLNSILNATGYGAKLESGRLYLQDANGASPFATVDNGSIDFSSIQALGLNGDLYYLKQNETAGVVTVTEPSTMVVGTAYGFWLWQYDPYNNQAISNYISATCTSNTAGNVAAVWVKIIAQLGVIGTPTTTIPAGYHFASATNSTYTLTITGATGYPTVSVSGVYSGGQQTSVVASQVSTPWVTSYGVTEGTNNLFGDMTWLRPYTKPFSQLTGYTASNSYDINVFTAIDSNGNKHLFYIFVNTGDTNYSNFITSYLTNILELGGGTPTAALIQLATAKTDQSEVL